MRLRQVRTGDEWGQPDLVILPGTKSVAADLERMRRAGLDSLVRKHAGKGKWILGVCGGLQMLGKEILDPHHQESAEERTPGLGLLELTTTFSPRQDPAQCTPRPNASGPDASGYEIHHGITSHESPLRTPHVPGRQFSMRLRKGPRLGHVPARLSGRRRIPAGIHQQGPVDSGLPPKPSLHVSHDVDGALDRLADIVRKHLDVNAIYRLLQLKR